jgi:hypothetical protein
MEQYGLVKRRERSAGESPPIEAGDTLDPVLLGPLLGGVLRIWYGEGLAACVRVSDTDRVRSVLARGAIARTSHEPERFREAGLVNESDDVLMLYERLLLDPTQSSEDRLEAGAHAIVCSFEHCYPPATSTALWEEAAEWLNDVIALAFGRGEFVIAETGGWDAIPDPYALAVPMKRPDGWRVHLEASPWPTSEYWSKPKPDQEAAVMTAPFPDGMSVAGLLLVQAIGMWARNPLDIVLGFGRAPDGAPPS